MLFVVSIIFSLVVFAGVSAFGAKKNLCTITINSNDEAQLFKKHLGTADWNFIELAPAGGENAAKSWFNEACQKNIRCDVLVVSGHFGGSFFGSSKLTLSMQDLEKNSCDSKCDGILKQPREVFLFGCNTLASKEKDHRSPEEYLQVLLADGFSVTQASQIVSFRYSGFGDSFKHSMSQIFATTPRIYGFSSVGPSGKKVAPYLEKYLQDSAEDYKNFSTFSATLGLATNEKLMSALRKTKITQATGLIPNLRNAEEKPYCYIRSENKTILQKLRFIKRLFKDSSAIKILSHIQSFLHELKTAENYSLSLEEQNALAEFANDKKLKRDLINLLNLQGDVYLPLKIDVLNTLKDLEIVNLEFVNTTLNSLIDLRTPFTDLRKNLLCSAQTNINIPGSSIPEARWSELEFLSALICVKPQDTAIHHKMAQVMLQSKVATLRATAIWFFYSVPPETIEIQKALATVLRDDSEVFVRLSAAIVLKNFRPTAADVLEILAGAQAQEKDSTVRSYFFF